MAPRKKCGCCECKKKSRQDDCSQYPAGIQKEDLLWAYFVMRMVCQCMGDPAVVFRKRPGQKRKKKKKGGEPTMTPFNLAMVCGAVLPPGEFDNSVAFTRLAETKAQEELKRKTEEEFKRLDEERRKKEEEEEKKRKEAEAAEAEEI